MRIERTVVVDTPVRRAFDYLADFTTTTSWEPSVLGTFSFWRQWRKRKRLGSFRSRQWHQVFLS